MTFARAFLGSNRAVRSVCLAVTATVVGAVLAVVPALPSAAAPAPSAPASPAPTKDAGGASASSPTTTIPPWDLLPAEQPAPGTAPKPPAPPTAKSTEATKPGFDEAKSVLIDAETTPTQATYRNPDGTRSAKISTEAVRFKDSAGTWVDYDMSIVARPDGRLGAKAGPNAATLAKKADGALATAETSAGPVTLRHTEATPAAAAVAKHEAKYEKALSGGRDIKVTLTPDGFEESVVLPDAKAPASYREEMDVPAGVTVRDAARGVELVDKAGTVIATYGDGYAYDDLYRRGEPPTPVSVHVVSQKGKVATLEVAIADPAWLTAPERAFPVVIDPVFAPTTKPGQGGRDINIIGGEKASQNFSGIIANQQGIYQGRPYRSLLHFDISALNGATVNYSGLYVYSVYTGFTYSCTNKPPLNVYALASGFSEATTWNTRPTTGALLNTVGIAHQPTPNGAGTNCPPNWEALPITSTVQGWVNGAPNHGLELRADEVDPDKFQFLWSGDAGYGQYAPFLWVDMQDRAPNPPTNLVATPNADGSVGLTWTPSAFNGSSPVDFYLFYSVNADEGTIASAAAGYCNPVCSVTMSGLRRSSRYYFWGFAHNGYNSYGYSNSFATSNTVTTAAEPLAGAGEQPWFSYDTFELNDRLSVAVNIGTGNLMVGGHDLNIPVVGGSRSIGRTYNSQARAASSALFGYGWRFSEAPDHRLEILYDGSARYWSPSGNAAVFGNGTPNTSPWTLATPPGLDATLVRNANGTYTMTFHADARKLTFRSDGVLLADADRYNNTITFSYGTGWPASITGSAGSSPGNTINVNYGGPGGKVSTITQTADGVTRTVEYTYDGAGNLWKVKDAQNRLVTFGYDTLHRMTSIIGPGTGTLSQVTQFGYDAQHRVTSVTQLIPNDPTSVTRYDYSTPGHTKVTDPEDHPAVDYEFDFMGRVSTIVDPKNPTPAGMDPAVRFTYNRNHKIETSRNGLRGTTVNDWSANSGESLKSSTDPVGARTVNNYSNSGPLAWVPDWVQDTLGNKTAIGYNDTVPDPRTVQNVSTGDWALNKYNSDGTVASSTTPNNISTPILEWLLQDPTRSTRYTYFPTRQLQTITPPAGTTLGSQSFTYDGAGRLKTATSGKGVVTTFTYDALDRIVRQDFTGGTPSIVLGYDANGNISSRTDASGLTTWDYDAVNRLRTKTLSGGDKLEYTYDRAGNMLSSKDAGGTTRYRYNKVNQLDQVTEPPPSGRTSVFAYDPDGRLTDTWAATGTGVTYDATGNTVVAPASFAMHIRRTYDPAGNLTNIRTTRASSDDNANRLSDLTYTYEVPLNTTCTGVVVGTKTDKRQRVTDALTNKTTDYCYDSAGRLIKAATTGGPTYTYGYDKNGNRTTDAAGTHNFNPGDQLTDAEYAYDADGNLTASSAYPTIGASPGLAYSGIGQTTGIRPAGQSAVPFTYAGGGQAERISAGATTAQNGVRGVQTETTAGAVSSYIRGPGELLVERTAGGDFYYYFDGSGSVIGLVDPSGNQRAAYTYDPYGSNATAAAVNGPLPANPWRYVGGYLDAGTGLYHLGARYYDPVMGRFTQLEAGTGYWYAGNDPINFYDPDGHSYRVNCGTITCSVYFSRETTKSLNEYMNEVTTGTSLGAAAACGAATKNFWLGFACGAADAIGGYIVQETVERAAKKDGCLKITFIKGTGTVTYISSNTGKYCFNDPSAAYISHGNGP